MTDNKHIVRIWGGLGNQLFQYALYMSFKDKGYDTYADISAFTKYSKGRNYQLPFLGIDVDEANVWDIIKLYCHPRDPVAKAIIKRIGKKTYYRQRENFYDPKVFDTDKGYFDGYWQSYKYFENVAEEIREKISFGNISDEIVDRIKKDNNSVSIHVRLGDYLLRPDLYGGICTEEYYKEAIKHIKDRIQKRTDEKTHFYVFSNDIDQAKIILGDDDDITYTNGYPEDEGYKDLYLMSLCQHHIIANSSFSWWGAFLGNYDDSITVAPKRWVNGIRGEDIIPSDWIRI
ncbi:alpha-1,2-fucosyltransferase [Butyrivibrio sp. AE3006]|uniref:alpha-1,2-fucosyltransferase n=1 Tax=Butyrivibrio sp. AE3006 TaxID=1280673 RepID=UPI0003F7149E|nr:alpha-1,2-fucosyltransferase [Butyrivibrio sp. AE3006]